MRVTLLRHGFPILYLLNDNNSLTVSANRNHPLIIRGGHPMENSKKEMAECLWLEINKAIVSSKNVKDYLLLMEEQGMIDFLSSHDFILDGRLLVQRILKDSHIQVAEENALADLQQKNIYITKNLVQNFPPCLN